MDNLRNQIIIDGDDPTKKAGVTSKGELQTHDLETHRTLQEILTEILKQQQVTNMHLAIITSDEIKPEDIQ